ncbi:MAG: ABC transporter ATP-binding protein [Thermoplasmata archaeon]|nr:ABC transporter ATP-binding protein [Thermoplasmata archaeon]
MEALVSRALSKTYRGSRGTVRALDAVDMSIAKGRLFAFLGRNGAGKTTFIKIATALLLPTSGTVELFGVDVVDHAREVREQIAIVPQEGKPFYHLTPREHIVEYLRVRGATGESAKNRAQEVLQGMGLVQYQDIPAMVLSGGLQQRTLVAMVLATEAPFLFLDEPTLGMDPFARRQVWEVIRRAARKGSTVLLTTHYLDEAEQLSEELSVIEGGHVLYQGTAEALKSKVHLEIRLQFEGGFTTQELASYGQVFTEHGRVTLLTTRGRVPELTQRALERKTAINVGPVTLEEAFLTLVGRTIEDEDAEAAP